MDFTKWGTVAAFAASPAVTMALCFFVWKLSVEVKEMRKSMYENGFVSKKDLADARDSANREHDEMWRRIAALEGHHDRNRGR